MRVIFAGTPEVAIPSLKALLSAGHDVVGVLTRPDAKSGRGRQLRPSPVRAYAESQGLPVSTPTSLRSESVQEEVASWRADVGAVVAYGAFVPTEALLLPTHGWVNLHFSLLPAWRGAAPVQHALMAGDEMTGASTFLLEQGMDTGPVIGSMTEPVRDHDTAGDLLERLAEAGSGLLVQSLEALISGQARPQPQEESGVSYAPKLTTAQAQIDWKRPDYQIDRLIRAMSPHPGAWTLLDGNRMKLAPVQHPASGDEPDLGLGPGQLSLDARGVWVGTATTPVRLTQVQPAGKAMMSAQAWAQGTRQEGLAFDGT